MNVQDVIQTIGRGESLDSRGAAVIMRYMMSGDGTDESKVHILEMLANRGETDEEIEGMLDVMTEMMIPVMHNYNDVLDMCGTGGDGKRTFNISTAASFVAAAAGVRVAKHGNHSSSGGVGSAGIFKMLGCDIMAEPEDVAGALGRHNICFMFAPRYHPAVRHAAGARRLLGRRSIFNLLGPLCNPAGVRRQLVGVPIHMLSRIPRILERRGSKCNMSVVSGDGLDELSPTSSNHIVLYRDGCHTRQSILPEDLSIGRATLQDICVKDEQEAMAAFVGAVSGTAKAPIIHTTAMNAAGALVVAGHTDSMGDGFETSMEIIMSGKAQKTLSNFVRDMGDISILENLT